MKTSIFEYKDYKKFVNDLVDSSENGGRGKRKALADAIHCQGAFITHVLSGNYHFSLEQAEACSRFFGLSKDETEFFLTLVNFNRAGTESLRSFYQRLISERIETYETERSRLNFKHTVAPEDQIQFYSSWKYAAVHSMSGIPEFQTREAISKRLNIPLDHVTSILQFLVEKGIIEKKKNNYFPSKNLLFLDRNSPYITQHHTIWRNRAIESLDRRKPADYHYSLVLACTEKETHFIREKLAECVKECFEIPKAGNANTVGALCLDFFEL